jgi:MtrB/PioB family decaheme-associated outer membrane protein
VDEVNAMGRHWIGGEAMRRCETTVARGGGRRGAALALLATAALLAGGGAFAPARADEDEQRYRELTQFGSEVELGFLWNSSDSFQFGNYTGLFRDGFFVLGNIDALWRGLGSDNDARFLRLQGLNLGLDSRYVGAEYGVQGRYGLFFEYDQLPVYEAETALFFHDGLGTESLTLDEGWIAGDNGSEAEMPLRDDLTHQFDIDHQRKRIGGGFSLVLPASLSFDARYDYEEKDGTKLAGAIVGINGGDPRSVIVPEPIDYVTQNFEAVLRYLGEKWQGSLGYYGSAFSNENNLLRWEVPYLNPGSWDPTAGFDGSGACVTPEGCGTGRKGQMPDNWFHQIMASGGVSLPYNTRVTLNTAFGWMLQDDDFLPYSVNANLAAETQGGAATDAADLAALPRTSLDGEIFTTVIDFKVASRPLPKLSTDLRYRFDNRENNTPQSTYFYIPSDATDQNVAANSDTGRINLPYSFTQHRVDVEAGYEVWKRTQLRLGYIWKLTDRDYQEVDDLTDHTLRMALTSRPHSMVSTRLVYSHIWRNGDYTGNAPFVQKHIPGYVDEEATACLASDAVLNGDLPASACPFENHPLLRKYYLAERERDELRFLLTLLPREDLTIGVNLNWAMDDYEEDSVGITGADHLSPGIDVSWTPLEQLSTHVFYTYQRNEVEQNGWTSVGFPFLGVPTFSQVVDPRFRWDHETDDQIHTVGVGFDWQAIPYRGSTTSAFAASTASPTSSPCGSATSSPAGTRPTGPWTGWRRTASPTSAGTPA